MATAIRVAAAGAAAIYLLGKLASSPNIGINLDEWQYPVKEFSRADGRLESQLKTLECVGELDIPLRIWNNATALVKEILDMLLQEMRMQASQYEGLVFDGYRKQGSGRDGLKIRTPDEFDVLLEYHIEGLHVEPVPIDAFPGLGEMKILNTDYEIERRFATWLRKNVIVRHQGSYYLRARILHQSVFESLLDKCREKIANKTKQNISFQLTRRMNPPSVNLTIKNIQRDKGIVGALWDWLLAEGNEPDVIDIDVVPAMMVVKEKARGTSGFIDCPRYAVVKWMEDTRALASRFEDPSMIWRICTSGYEKHYMDLARNDTGKRYIMTACRIIKTFMSKEKDKRLPGQLPLPISTFLRSFYLKNIAFYCMLFTKSVKGVRQALGYFLGFLKISLEEECLPEFFHGNSLLKNDFPSCAEGDQANMFEHISRETLINARHSLGTVLFKLSDTFDKKDLESGPCQKFKSFITSSI
ncbi:hypothetical protein CHS0354_008737 [Potamilus streckersoni]|uniref:Mab-21-like nucleotidyltransferase domain-containing protein n=1 Tax=Potamilus streckersoni TaxID=2493646 RepID=A0AAE0W7K4_9BIVA|nr:hypothetical protein CHS0354_008737 [Potamilus streckersoni]